MPTWTITGEAGKALDSSERALADINVKAATVTFRSLATDTFVFTQEVEAGTTVPEKGQSVTLERDGTVFFQGVATDVSEAYGAGSWTVTTTVSGPWWYAENIALTLSTTSPAGGSSERQTLKYGSQNLGNSILTTINRGLALGVPWQAGTVNTFFTFPQLTLNQHTVGQELAELVRMCPDAMTWMNYATSPPSINVIRRGSAASRTITIGTDDVVSYSISPLTQLQVSQVRLPYATRSASGLRAWAEQSAGSSSAGKVQVITVSGPEMDTFLPPDPPSESVKLTTISTGSTGPQFTPVANTVPAIASLIQKYGAKWYGTSGGASSITAGAGDGTVVRVYSQSSGGTGQTYTPARASFRDSNDNAVTGHFLYPGITIPDWLADSVGGTRVKYEFTYYVNHRWNSSLTNNLEPYFPGLSEFIAGGAGDLRGFTQDSPFNRISLYFRTYTGEGLVLPSAYNGHTFYRPPEYTFVAPPSGFASNMLSAQSWLPYEGTVEILDGDAGAIRYRGRTFNLSGSRLSEHASMNAMVESEAIDLMTGGIKIAIGSPPRIDYRNLLDKVRRTPQDNIVTA